MAFRKRRHCLGPHALEVTNLNAVASNLLRTCFKSKSLPNSVIFITELHLHVSLPSAAAQIQENLFEPDGRLERGEVPDRLWITKITYLFTYLFNWEWHGFYKPVILMWELSSKSFFFLSVFCFSCSGGLH